MFDKIKAFYTEHKDEINGAAFVALGGLLVTGGVLLRRSNRKVDELQTFHDDIYTALKNGFGVVLDTENGNDYMVRLVEPAVEALEESKDAS
jgi:hypothetical protein